MKLQLKFTLVCISCDTFVSAQVYDAVIVGAGWAGLGVAKLLKSENINNVLVLEARDYVGGRSKTITLNDGKEVDLGSQWIHGATWKNPVWNAALEAETAGKVDVIEVDYTFAIWSKIYGGGTPHEITAAQEAHLNDMFEDWMKYMDQNKPNNKAPDNTLRKNVDDYIVEKSLSPQDVLGLEYIIDCLVVQEYAASLEDLSHKHWDSDLWLGEPYDDAVMQQGYSPLIDHFAAPVLDKIQLESVVTTIDWNDNDIVKVTYEKGGNTFQVQAKHVAVTVPLGVLKKGSINFTPPLPSEKQDAIDKLGNGLMNKVILRWPDDLAMPWHDNAPVEEWVEFITQTQGRWTTFTNEMQTTGYNILIAFSSGREAERVEGLTEAEVFDEVMASIRDIYGSQIPNPQEYVISKWGQDPFAYGAYSYHETESGPLDRQHLGDPMENRVWWAGEAVHKSYPSTTAGALMTGELVGKKIELNLP